MNGDSVSIKERIYEWMVDNLPFRLMYHKVPFDGAYLWRPRWGWTKKQLKNAEKFAAKYKNLLWE